MLLQVSNQFSWSNLPDSDFTFIASRNNEFVVVAKCNCCYTIFVCIINLPQECHIIASISSYFTIRPTWENDFIGEHGTKWMNSSSLGLSVNAPGFHGIVVSIPQSDGSIGWACNEFIRYFWHIVNIDNWICMVFSKEHLWEITDSDSIKESLVGGSKELNAVVTWTQALDAAIKLGLH